MGHMVFSKELQFNKPPRLHLALHGRTKIEQFAAVSESKQNLLDKLSRKKIHISYDAKYMIKSSDFASVFDFKQINLVCVSTNDLGLTVPSTTRLLHEARELGLDTCPLEVVLAYRLQYASQLRGEEIIMGIEPINNEHGDPCFLTLYRDFYGTFGLGSHSAKPDDRFGSDKKLIFVANKSF